MPGGEQHTSFINSCKESFLHPSGPSFFQQFSNENSLRHTPSLSAMFLANVFAISFSVASKLSQKSVGQRRQENSYVHVSIVSTIIRSRTYLWILLKFVVVKIQPLFGEMFAIFQVSCQNSRNIPRPSGVSLMQLSEQQVKCTYLTQGTMPSAEIAPRLGRRPKQPHQRAGLVTLPQAVN